MHSQITLLLPLGPKNTHTQKTPKPSPITTPENPFIKIFTLRVINVCLRQQKYQKKKKNKQKRKQEKQQSEMIGYYLKSRWYQSTTNSCGRKHEITGSVIKGFVVVVPVEKTSQTYYSTNSRSCSCSCSSSPPGSRSCPWSCSSFPSSLSSSSSSASFLVLLLRLLRLVFVVVLLLLLLRLLWLAHKSFTG